MLNTEWFQWQVLPPNRFNSDLGTSITTSRNKCVYLQKQPPTNKKKSKFKGIQIWEVHHVIWSFALKTFSLYRTNLGIRLYVGGNWSPYVLLHFKTQQYNLCSLEQKCFSGTQNQQMKTVCGICILSPKKYAWVSNQQVATAHQPHNNPKFKSRRANYMVQ